MCNQFEISAKGLWIKRKTALFRLLFVDEFGKSKQDSSDLEIH
jgi:hypothetical protein